MLHFVAKRFKMALWERLKEVEGGLSGGSCLGVR